MIARIIFAAITLAAGAALAGEIRPPVTTKEDASAYARRYYVEQLGDIFAYSGKDRNKAEELIGPALKATSTWIKVDGGYQYDLKWEKCENRLLPTCTEIPR